MVPRLKVPVNNTGLFAVQHAASWLLLLYVFGGTLKVRKLPPHQMSASSLHMKTPETHGYWHNPDVKNGAHRVQNGPRSESRDSLSDRLTSRDNRHAEPQHFCHQKSSPRNKAEKLSLPMTRRLIGAGRSRPLDCAGQRQAASRTTGGLLETFKKVRGGSGAAVLAERTV